MNGNPGFGFRVPLKKEILVLRLQCGPSMSLSWKQLLTPSSSHFINPPCMAFHQSEEGKKTLSPCLFVFPTSPDRRFIPLPWPCQAGSRMYMVTSNCGTGRA